jgi:flagellar basal body-associated protein FliL
MNKLVIALIALNLLGTATGGYFTYMALKDPLIMSPEKSDMKTEDYMVYHNIFSDKPILFTLEPFTVNLGHLESNRVIQVELNLEMHDEKSYEEVVSKSAMVRDTVVKVLAQKDYRDLATVQGKLFLKDDISSEVNKQLKYGLIKGVYFTRFIVQ